MTHGDLTRQLSDDIVIRANGRPITADENTNVIKSIPWTREQKVILSCIGLSRLFNNMGFSILAPFFPTKAEEHGATPSQVGLIFGVFFLTQFVFAIIFGKLIPVIGLKPTFMMGYTVSATCTILLGFVDMIDKTSTFLGVSFSLRILGSMGVAATATSSVTIVVNTFPDSVSKTVGSLGAFSGLGMILGPFIGGLLYELGGFVLPFVSLGGAMLVHIMIMVYILPGNLSQISNKTGSFLHIMCVPGVWVGTISILVGAISMTFLESTLCQKLEEFNLNAFEIGLVFLLMGMTYGIGSPLIGLLADKSNWSRKLIIFGYCCSIIGYLIIGPWPQVNIPHTVLVICVGVVMLSIGISSNLIPCLRDMLMSVIFNGFPQETKTYSVLSGMSTGAYSLGGFIGPTLGGSLVQQFDFATATLIYGVLCLLSGFLTLILSFLEFRCKERRGQILCSRFLPEATGTENEQTYLLNNA